MAFIESSKIDHRCIGDGLSHIRRQAITWINVHFLSYQPNPQELTTATSK